MMMMTTQLRKNHEPKIIGINDLLAKWFSEIQDNEFFLGGVEKPELPSLPERYEITMGRDGSFERDFSKSFSDNDVSSGRMTIEAKQNWLEKAISYEKFRYGQLFSSGEMLKFKDVVEVYDESATSPPQPVVRDSITILNRQVTRGPYETNSIMDREFSDGPHKQRYKMDYTPDREFTVGSSDWNIVGHTSYCDDTDIAMVIDDSIVASVLITDPDNWSGLVRFFRVVKLLVTRHSERLSVESENFEPPTCQVFILFCPDREPSSFFRSPAESFKWERTDLFERLSNVKNQRHLK